MKVERMPNHAPMSSNEREKRDRRILRAITSNLTRSEMSRVYGYKDSEIDKMAREKGLSVREAPKKRRLAGGR